MLRLFGLSPKAVEYYLNLKGLKCFFYKRTKESDYRAYKKCTIEEAEAGMGSDYTSTIDLGNSFTEWPKNESGYFYYGDIKRDDEFLIQTVEKLGSKAASGWAANLEVVEVPDGINWELDEYDGIESIHEVHRSW